jgi:putative ABC transport system permease protein
MRVRGMSGGSGPPVVRGMSAALAVTAVVLGVAAASAPLFLSSVRSAALADELQSLDPRSAGVTVGVYGAVDPHLFARADDEVRDAAEAVRGLSEALVTVQGPDVTVGGEAGLRLPLFARTDVLDHVQIVERGVDGVWLASSAATQLGVGVGDEVSLRFGDATVTAGVGGIYRDLAEYVSTLYWRAPDPLPAGDPIASYWAPLANLVVIPNQLGPVVQPPFVLADPEDVVRLGRQLNVSALHRWEFAYPTDGKSYAEVARTAAAYRRFEARLRDPLASAGAALGDLAQYEVSLDVASLLRAALGRVDATVASVADAVQPLALAAVGLSLVVVGAAGAFAVRRRRIEVRLRAVQGVHPAAQGARAAADAVLPIGLGGLAGWALTVPLVRAAGPSPLLAAGIEVVALRRVLLAAAAGVLLVGLVTAVLARAFAVETSGRAGHVVARLPWEAVLLTAAAVAYYDLAVDAAAPDGRASAVGLLFPVLFVAGTAGVGVRGLARLLPRVRRLTDTSPPALFLAARRLALASAMARLLVTAGALAFGMLVYAATLVASTERTVAAKAAVTVGSDVRAELDLRTPVPAHIPAPVTVVTRGEGELVPGEVEVDLLAVEPRRSPEPPSGSRALPTCRSLSYCAPWTVRETPCPSLSPATSPRRRRPWRRDGRCCPSTWSAGRGSSPA